MRKATSDRLSGLRSSQPAKREILRLLWRRIEHGWSVIFGYCFTSIFPKFTSPKSGTR
jgi:hypothetical protein